MRTPTSLNNWVRILSIFSLFFYSFATATEPSKEVPAIDIMAWKTRVIGNLGKELGTRLQVSLVIPPQPYLNYYISIISIDGKILPSPIMIPMEDHQSGSKGYEKIPVTDKGTQYLVVGYETGAYISSPAWIWQDNDITPNGKETDGPSMPYRFQTKFMVVKVLDAQKIPSVQ